jgi:hypothetical protein
MTARRVALLAPLLGIAMSSATTGCATRKLGTFGLASTEARPQTFREIGPAAGISCGFSDSTYASAVEDALRRRPPANVLLDARFTANVYVRCLRVEGMAVVVD